MSDDATEQNFPLLASVRFEKIIASCVSRLGPDLVRGKKITTRLAVDMDKPWTFIVRICVRAQKRIRKFRILMWNWDLYGLVHSIPPQVVLFSCVQAQGADTDLKNMRGQTALMRSACRNHPDVLAELPSHGADDLIPDNDGNHTISCRMEEYNYWQGFKTRKEHLWTSSIKNYWKKQRNMIIVGNL